MKGHKIFRLPGWEIFSSLANAEAKVFFCFWSYRVKHLFIVTDKNKSPLRYIILSNQKLAFGTRLIAKNIKSDAKWFFTWKTIFVGSFTVKLINKLQFWYFTAMITFFVTVFSPKFLHMFDRILKAPLKIIQKLLPLRKML